MKKQTESDKDRILREFMLENFSYDGLREIKFFDKTVKRKDYQKQADILCHFFGFKTVFEYGTIEVRAHLTFAGERPLHVHKDGELKPEPFVTVIKSLYE